MIPAYIINYNLRTWPKAMCEVISERLGCEPIIIDNCSTCEQLLDWYESCDYKVLMLDKNYGHTAFWEAGIRETIKSDYFILSDPDLGIESLPADTIDYLKDVLHSRPFVGKVGLSLRIDDYPEDSPIAEQARIWETPFWHTEFDGKSYGSPIDTTFALYPNTAQTEKYFIGGRRAAWPYTAKHLPFYLTKDTITEEIVRYLKTANKSASTMARYLGSLVDHYEFKHGLVL